MTPIEILESYQAKYDKEYKVKLPQIVTTKVTKLDDYQEGSIMRRVRVTDKETMINDGYEEQDRVTSEGLPNKTYEKCIVTIPPRKFYSMKEVRTFMVYVRRIVGRDISDDERELLLRTIASGRQYDLVCLIDRTEELESVTKWVK